VVTTAGTDTLSLRGTVARNIQLDPPALDLRKVFRGDTVSAAVTISWARQERPAFGRVTAGPHIAAARVDSLRPNSYVLAVQVAPRAIDGPFRDSAIVETGSPNWPHLIVPVSGSVIGFLAASPAYLDFGTVDRNTDNWGTVSVRSKRKQRYSVTSVRARPEYLKAELRERTGRVSTLAVLLPRGTPPGRIEGTVEVYVDNSDTPELVVPVRGIVK
jgi:hypothetical protein